MAQKNFSFITNNQNEYEYLLDSKVYFASFIEKAKVKRFVILSATLHAVFASLVLTYSLTQIEKPKVETITIELTNGSNAFGDPQLKDGSSLRTNSNQLMPTQTAAIAEGSSGKTEALAPTKEDIIIPKIQKPSQVKIAKATKSAPLKTVKSKVEAPRVAVASQTKQSARSEAKIPKAQPIYVPETLDDIEAPELAETSIANNLSDDFADQELSKDFDKIDNKHKKALGHVQTQFDSEINQMESATNQDLESLENQLADENNKLTALSNNLKTKNQLLAEAAAAEKQEAESRKAKELAALQERKSSGFGSGNGHGEGNSKFGPAGALGSQVGVGKNGRADGAGTQLGNGGQQEGGFAGLPSGVRSLDQLRQKPGNPRPNYDYIERLRGHQGAVVFYAYITKEGTPVNFKLVKSTGYQNLDTKTLTALRKWRFYPGQEGWVELPFRWDLKGGPQEMPTFLRRVSQK